jgi:RNA polymerase sigma factor (sigma-70 family)
MPFRRKNIHSSDHPADEGESGFDALFRRYFPGLCYFAQRILPADHDAADLVMDCFARIWEKRAAIDNPEKLGPFLYTSVRNACFDLLRKKRLSVVRLDDAGPDDPTDDSPGALQSLIQAETLRLLYEQAEQLPPQLKIVFKRYFIDGESEQTISEALGKSYHTVRGQRLRAVEILREKAGIKTDKL